MTKYFIAGVSAFAMMTGVALAQGVSSDTTTTTTQTTTSPSAPPAGSFSATKTQKTIDSTGTETDKTQTYSNGANGSNSKSSSVTTAPDGTLLNMHREERTVSPVGESTTTNYMNKTTTTETK
jgi:hypothetical protein